MQRFFGYDISESHPTLLLTGVVEETFGLLLIMSLAATRSANCVRERCLCRETAQPSRLPAGEPS
jgi:hypothetical protein